MRLIMIGASSVFLVLLIESAYAKTLFSLRVGNVSHTLMVNTRQWKDACFDRQTTVSNSRRCSKELHVYLISGQLQPGGLTQLNNSHAKLGQQIVPLLSLPTETNITIDGPVPVAFSLVAELHQSAAPNNYTLLARYVISRANNNVSDWLPLEWLWPVNVTQSKVNSLRLGVQYKTQCKSSFYGPSCQVYCDPRDDYVGHYTCLPNGQRHCLPGWSAPDSYCLKPVCPGCHEKGGKCDEPGLCRCQVGWHGSNCSQCQRYAGCDQGYCIEPNECRCNAGWVGRFCNNELDMCKRNPCLNGAKCIDNPDPENSTRFQCLCASGFTGSNCDRSVTSLRPTTRVPAQPSTTKSPPAPPCANSDASCASFGTATNRLAPTNVRSHPCLPSPCKNGATCVLPRAADAAATNESFTCVCQPGYTGTRCETDQYLCRKQRNCFDPHRCETRIYKNGAQCVCIGDYVGHSCDIINCTRQPCANGGYCVSDDGLCRCKPGFNGSHCEVESNRCQPNPCVNGICDQLGGSAFCDCFVGWVGETCNVSVHGTRFVDRPSAVAAAAGSQEPIPLISPALFWTVIAVCVVLIVVLLVIAKVLISGIKKKQRSTTVGVSSPQLCLVSPTDERLVQASVDRHRRLHAHLARHQPSNNLNLVKSDIKADEPLNICAKKPPADDDSVDACDVRLLGLGTSSSANSSTLFNSCTSKIGSNNVFNPNVNVEKVLPSKNILTFSSKAELQNHTNATRFNSSPLPVRCVSPPSWNAHRTDALAHSGVPQSHTNSQASSSSSIRQDAQGVCVSWQQSEIGSESSAYRASGSSSFR